MTSSAGPPADQDGSVSEAPDQVPHTAPNTTVSALLATARRDLSEVVDRTTPRQLAAKQSSTTWVFGLAALIIAIAGALGGLNAAGEATLLPTAAEGAAVVAEPWTVTIEGSRVASTDEIIQPSAKSVALPWNSWFLVVIATITVTDDRTTRLNTALTIDAAGLAKEPDRVMLVNAIEGTPQGQPGLPVRVAYLWNLSTPSSPTSELIDEAPEPEVLSLLPAFPPTVLISVMSSEEKRDSYGDLVRQPVVPYTLVTSTVTRFESASANSGAGGG